MAVTRVKSTFSLDVETVRMLADLARRWKVSKSEALRRAIRAAAALGFAGAGPLDALDRAQRALRLSSADAARWEEQVLAERREERSS